YLRARIFADWEGRDFLVPVRARSCRSLDRPIRRRRASRRPPHYPARLTLPAGTTPSRPTSGKYQAFHRRDAEFAETLVRWLLSLRPLRLRGEHLWVTSLQSGPFVSLTCASGSTGCVAG